MKSGESEELLVVDFDNILLQCYNTIEIWQLPIFKSLKEASQWHRVGGVSEKIQSKGWLMEEGVHKVFTLLLCEWICHSFAREMQNPCHLDTVSINVMLSTSYLLILALLKFHRTLNSGCLPTLSSIVPLQIQKYSRKCGFIKHLLLSAPTSKVN